MRAHTHAIRGAGCCRAGTSHPTPALAFRRRTATALRRPIVVQVAAAASDTAPSPFPETSGDELVKLLRSKANVLVLDVRNPDEVAAGRIVGSVNVLAKDIMSTEDTAIVDAFIAGPASAVEQVIVHCMFCQSRGPKSAKALTARLQQLGHAGQPRVSFLTNGIGGFVQDYAASEADLLELPEGGWSPPAH